MPPRNPELPEGTDHIINGAMETNGGAGAGSEVGGSSASGFIGSGAPGDGTGGMAAGGGAGFSAGSGGGGGDFGGSGGGDFGGSGGESGGGQSALPVKQQLREGARSVRDQATTKVRDFAVEGKNRATTALDDFSQVVSEAAQSIDERLGSEYGEYARRAADAVSGFADTLRNKEVDELYDDARNVVRKSPAVAIGVAAAVGFALVRLVKSGLPEQRDVEFQPDANLGAGSATKGSGTGAGGSAGTGV